MNYKARAVNHEKILIIKLGAFGDFLLALSSISAIRAHHPNADITLLTTRPYSGIAKQSGYVDHIWIDEKPKWHDWMKLAQMRRKLMMFDRVYDLQTNDRSALYFRLSWEKPFLYKGTAPYWIGTSRGSHVRVKDRRKEPIHAYERHREMMQATGIEIEPLPDIGFMQADVTEHLQKIGQDFVLFMIGCAPTRPLKKWPRSHFLKLAQFIIDDYHLKPVIIGAAAEADDAKWLIENNPDIVDMTCKTSFYDIAELARHASFAIGNDTGPTHLTALAGCPTLTLFSTQESDPRKSKPIGKHTYELAVEDLQILSPEKVVDEVRRVFGV